MALSSAIQDDISATIPSVAGLANALNDKLLRWFQAGGATSNDLQDAERQFLVARGETERDTQDMWERYLRVTLGLGTLALDDLQKKYWGGGAGGSVGDSGAGVADLTGFNLGAATFVRATAAMTFYKLPTPYVSSNAGGSTQTTPNNAGNALPDNFSVIVDAALVNWTAASNVLCSRWGAAGNLQFWFASTGSALSLGTSRDGTATTFPASAAHGFTANSRHKVGAVFNINGDVKFYEQVAGVWTLITATTTTAGALFQSTDNINVGHQGVGGGSVSGKLFTAEVRRGGLDGAVVARFDPADNTAYPPTLSWVSKGSANGETWTITQVGGSNVNAVVKGELISVGAGFARHWTDPATGSPMGVLLEGQRINLALRSEDLTNASWAKTDSPITADQAFAPDGTFTADLVTEGVAGTAKIEQAVTITANAPTITSVFLKRGNHDWAFVQLADSTLVAAVGCYFNLATGAVGTAVNTGVGTNAAGNIEAYPGGWYRCYLRGNVNGAFTAVRHTTRSASADNSAVRVNNGTRYQWGAGVEDNCAQFSAYIPTVAATVQRNTDSLSFPAIAGNDTRGALVTEISVSWPNGDAANNAAVVGFTNGASALFMNNVAVPTHIRANDGTNGPQKSGLNSCFNVTRKRGLSWGAGGLSVTGDGQVVVNSAYDGTIGSGVPFFLGNHSTLLQPLFGCIKSFRMYPFQPTDLQLAAMTA